MSIQNQYAERSHSKNEKTNIPLKFCLLQFLEIKKYCSMYQLWNYAQLSFAFFFKEKLFFVEWMALGSKQNELIPQTLYSLLFFRQQNIRDTSRHRFVSPNARHLCKIQELVCFFSIFQLLICCFLDQISFQLKSRKCLDCDLRFLRST